LPLASGPVTTRIHEPRRFGATTLPIPEIDQELPDPKTGAPGVPMRAAPSLRRSPRPDECPRALNAGALVVPRPVNSLATEQGGVDA